MKLFSCTATGWRAACGCRSPGYSSWPNSQCQNTSRCRSAVCWKYWCWRRNYSNSCMLITLTFKYYVYLIIIINMVRLGIKRNSSRTTNKRLFLLNCFELCIHCVYTQLPIIWDIWSLAGQSQKIENPCWSKWYWNNGKRVIHVSNTSPHVFYGNFTLVSIHKTNQL